MDSQSAAGRKFVERLLTVVAMQPRQGRSNLDFRIQVLRSGSPSLLTSLLGVSVPVGRAGGDSEA